MTGLLPIVLVCLASRLALGHPNGAPNLSCKELIPGHTRKFGRHYFPISDQKEPSNYIIKAEWDEKREFVRVSITGSTLQGFLIQARETLDGPAVGNFKAISNESQYLDCTGDDFKFDPQSTVTHKSPTIKNDLFFLWAPSSGKSRNVTFYATIAKSKEEYWAKLPSNQVKVLGTSNLASTVSVSTFSNLILILNVLFRLLSM